MSPTLPPPPALDIRAGPSSFSRNQMTISASPLGKIHPHLLYGFIYSGPKQTTPKFLTSLVSSLFLNCPHPIFYSTEAGGWSIQFNFPFFKSTSFLPALSNGKQIQTALKHYLNNRACNVLHLISPLQLSLQQWVVFKPNI